MPDIHPAATVDPAARLAEDVQVGPYCVVEAGVEIGPGTRLIAHVHLSGPLVLGARNVVHPFAAIGAAAQDRSFDPQTMRLGTRIGDDNVLREHTTVNAGTTGRATTIGNRNYLMAGAHVAHDARIGDDCTFANHTAVAGHCEVGDGVIFGGGAMAQQHLRIGRLAFVGGLTGINRDLPPFCMVHRAKSVSSLNLVGLRRAGLRASIDPLRRAFQIVFRSGLALPDAAARIEAELGGDAACVEFADFLRTSERGVLHYSDSRGTRGVADRRGDEFETEAD